MRTRFEQYPAIYTTHGPYVVQGYTLPKWTIAGGPASVGSAVSKQTKYGYSEITDDAGPSRKVKYVLHKKREYSLTPVATYDESTATNRYVTTGQGCHWYSWGYYGVIDFPGITVTYPQTLGALTRKARDGFFNLNEVDNLLNIVEADQFTNSIKSLNDLVKRVKGDASYASLALQGKLRARLRDNSGFYRKVPANLYLMWSFGFAPLINDMRAIFKATKSIKDAMARNVRNAGKPRTVVASTVGSLTVNGVSGMSQSTPSPLNNTYWHPQVIPVDAPTLRVGVRGINTVKYNSASFQKLDYLMNRFLSAGPASLLWERIPFSFVVDWFADLSGVVNALDNALTGTSKVITDSWSSEKYDVFINAVKHPTSAWTSSEDGKAMVQNRLSYYRRDPVLTGVTTGGSGRFGQRQFQLSAALLDQLVTNLKVLR